MASRYFRTDSACSSTARGSSTCSQQRMLRKALCQLGVCKASLVRRLSVHNKHDTVSGVLVFLSVSQAVYSVVVH